MFNNSLGEIAKIVMALAPVTPSSASPAWVSLKGYQRAAVIILAANATTVTGSAIALAQATAVAGTGTKTLAFATAKRNIDTGASDTLVDFAVSSNTFTTDATNSKNLMYVIDVDPATLDVEGGFDCFRVTMGNATASVLSAHYVLWTSRYGGKLPSAVVD